MKAHHLPLLLLLLCLASCGGKQQSAPVDTTQRDYSAVQRPQFDADSAYSYVAAQLSYGHRYPGSKGHQQCADYLERTMSQWCDTVIVQTFSAQLWDGQTVKGKNIIASIAPQAENRVLLAAHWDSRLWADHDPDSANHKQPIMGANDGASGVGALMEIARVMHAMPPSVGVDIIFFDLEDQGVPEWADRYVDDSWCKGSQYWAQHPHRPYYRAIYGILFDMVGTAQPRFTKEEVSRQYAPGLTDKVWKVAASLGHGQIFVNEKTSSILDDHLYVNQILGIPMLDIVQNTPGCSFVDYWHTLGDNLDKIDRNTLRIVSDVTLATIYADFPAQSEK